MRQNCEDWHLNSSSLELPGKRTGQSAAAAHAVWQAQITSSPLVGHARLYHTQKSNAGKEAATVHEMHVALHMLWHQRCCLSPMHAALRHHMRTAAGPLSLCAELCKLTLTCRCCAQVCIASTSSHVGSSAPGTPAAAMCPAASAYKAPASRLSCPIRASALHLHGSADGGMFRNECFRLRLPSAPQAKRLWAMRRYPCNLQAADWTEAAHSS